MKICVNKDEWRDLREFPGSPLPPELHNWFEVAKITMRLPGAKVYFIESKVAKEFSNGVIIRIGALGQAYVDDNLFVFIESGDGREQDKETIIHEMLHLLGAVHTVDNGDLYEAEVRKFKEATERNLDACIER